MVADRQWNLSPRRGLAVAVAALGLCAAAHAAPKYKVAAQLHWRYRTAP